MVALLSRPTPFIENLVAKLSLVAGIPVLTLSSAGVKSTISKDSIISPPSPLSSKTPPSKSAASVSAATAVLNPK